MGPDMFEFLGVRGSLVEVGWDGAQRETLWRYNQHYFDDLNAREASSRDEWHHRLIDDWVARNPPAGGTGWEPYPTALRIVNWLKWTLAGNALPPLAHASLAIQVRCLSHRLETHLLGNHLLANAKALVFAGHYFEGPEAESWRQAGEQLLARELAEQILADGGHFERSPMYHLIVLEDMLDLVNLRFSMAMVVPEAWRTVVGKMLEWARRMRHPDGEIPFFNDAAFGIAPTPQEIDAYAGRLGWPAISADLPQGPVFLEESGYGCLQAGPAALFVDLAPVGPDYLPGHAHADTLSFELSLGKQRIVVNGGTSVYGRGEERQRQRSTAAHATVVVDGTDSSEVWAGFRVGRRARVTSARIWRTPEAILATGTHDGYRRLPGRPIHRRTWALTGKSLSITDEVLGAGSHQVEIILPLAAGLVPARRPDGGIEIGQEGSPVAFIVFEPTDGTEDRLEQIHWHSRFGQRLPTWRVRRLVRSELPLVLRTRIEWSKE